MQAEVLIVGAGPAGLTLANDLLSRHVRFNIIDPRPSFESVCPEIVLLHARTIEQLGNLGFADTLIEAGTPLRLSNIYAPGKKIVQLDYAELDSPYKFILAIDKNVLERILADNLLCAEINIGHSMALSELTDKGTEVEAQLTGLDSNSTATYRFVVGCDGPDSVVKKALNLPFEEAPNQDLYGRALIDFECDLKGDELHAFFAEEGALVLIPQGEKRWFVIFEADESSKKSMPGTAVNAKLGLPTIVQALRARTGITIKESGLSLVEESARWFRAQPQLVASYQKDNVFLAGDAVHLYSPLGSLNVNVAIQDVLNLGWKLGLTGLGLSATNLIQSYTEERHGVGMAYIKSAEHATKVVSLKSPVAKSARQSLMSYLAAHELVQQRMLNKDIQTGISYRRMTLAQESHRPQAETITHSLFPLPFKKATNEMPGLGAWLDFGDAARAGDYAPDAELDDYGFRLSTHIGSPRFKLLLFDGYEPSDLGYKNLFELEYRVASKFCDWVDIYVVVPFPEGVRELPNYALTIFDADRYLHEYYGAAAECLYLIRPDGYIGFKGQPAAYDKLEAYLQRIFQPNLVSSGRHRKAT